MLGFCKKMTEERRMRGEGKRGGTREEEERKEEREEVKERWGLRTMQSS